MDEILHTKLGPGLDFDPLEEKQEVSAVASNVGLDSITFSRAQEKQLKYLIENGGKYSAGTVFVQMPNGKTMSVDPFGRVKTIAG